VTGLFDQDCIERVPRLPVLVPAGLPAERAEHEPYVVQVELAEEEQRVGVLRILHEDRFRGRSPLGELRHELAHQTLARRAGLECLVLVLRFADGAADLKQQR
jgi:hypothetical protein